MEYKGFIYAPTPKTAWDNLSMQEKSEMMKVAVRNGITDLKTIRKKYNEFAEGGNLPENDLSDTNQFGGGGYVPSRAIRQRIANWEGAAMDRDTIDPLSGKVAKKNRSFEEVATSFVNAIPKDIRGQVLGNQELADNLYSYAYNVGPGKFKERVVPALRRYYQGNGSVSEVTDSMWASGDKKLRGLRRRRTEERSGVSRALQGDNAASPVSYISQTDNNGFVPFQPMLPEVFEAPHPVVPYSIADTPKESKEVAVSPYDIKVLEGQRKRDNLQHFMNVLNMVYGDNTEDEGSFFLPFGTLGYNNTFNDGGKIHIKPENRGKFTALKERTGHSATWFKEHGTPAQKKMATFALNARHWKHGLGGNLFDDGGDKDNIFKYTNSNGDVRYVYQDNSDSEEVPVRPLNTIFPDPAQWTFIDDAGKFYTPRRTTPTNTAELNPDNRTGFERALDNYIGEAFNTVPKGYHTLPAIGAAAFGLANPYVEAALTSGFGAHGLNHWLNEGIDGWGDAAMTALEVVPLGRLVKPVFKEAATAIESYKFPLGRPQIPENYFTFKPQVRTKVGDVEIDNPGLYYHQSDAGKANNFVSTGRMRTPLEEYWLAKEEAGEKIPLAIRSGIRPGYPQDPGSAMFSQGNLWYGLSNNKPDLLVTAREMPIANKNASVMSNKASLRKLEEQGTRRVTNDNIYTQGPHNRQNTTAYVWEPGYGYRRVFAEETPAIEWSEVQKLSSNNLGANGAPLESRAVTPQITVENAASITPEQWTTAQDAAITRGDIVEAQRLRDLHARTKEYDPIHEYHGSNKVFEEFNESPHGIYFTPDEPAAKGYMRGFTPTKYDVYLNKGKDVVTIDNNGLPWNKIDEDKAAEAFGISKEDLHSMINYNAGAQPWYYDFLYSFGFRPKTNYYAIDQLAKVAKQQGKTSLNLVNAVDNGKRITAIKDKLYDQHIVFKPNQIKSADAVTYDDNGVRIPLGNRDNFKLNDIRYGLLPFLGLGAAGTLYGKQE